jgi:hypothetical protein
VRKLTFLITVVFLGYLKAVAQADPEAVQYAQRYLHNKTTDLSNYQSKYQRRIGVLLQRMERKEKRVLQRIARTDSTRTNRLRNTADFGALAGMTADSLKHNSFARRANASIDSLKAIQSFIDQQSQGKALPGDQYTEQIKSLKQHFDYEQQLNALIKKRTADLKDAANGITGLQGIDKQSFYAVERLKACKQIAQSPDALEEKALAYLQGSPGFTQAMKGTGPDASPEAASMQQTQQQLTASLQQKFSGNLSQLSSQMNGQINGWQNKLADTRNTISKANNLLHQAPPAFKVNPMRCLPFSQRLEKQFNIQTTRATALSPALLETSFMLGFRQNARLSYGTGLALNTGLGQNWSNICVSFQGLGYRTYLQWKGPYGLSAYGGYERMYSNQAAPKETDQPFQSLHRTKYYTESLLLGLALNYKVSQRFNGGLQLLADIWWREKGLRSPFVFRISSVSK